MRTIARGRDPEVAKLVRHLAARRIAAEGNSRIRAARVVVGGGAGVDGVGHAATDGAEEERLARRDAHTLRRDELRRCKPPGPRVSASAAATACAMHARASPRVQAHNGTSAAADCGCALRRPHEPSSATGRRVTPPELTSMSSGRACSEATSLLFYFFSVPHMALAPHVRRRRALHLWPFDGDTRVSVFLISPSPRALSHPLGDMTTARRRACQQEGRATWQTSRAWCRPRLIETVRFPIQARARICELSQTLCSSMLLSLSMLMMCAR